MFTCFYAYLMVFLPAEFPSTSNDFHDKARYTVSHLLSLIPASVCALRRFSSDECFQNRSRRTDEVAKSNVDDVCLRHPRTQHCLPENSLRWECEKKSYFLTRIFPTASSNKREARPRNYNLFSIFRRISFSVSIELRFTKRKVRWVSKQHKAERKKST